ncbi:MAG: hypothetical protein OEZ65_07970 [Gemmatimonadota bacterium]|nr:hypothetical protein [Gemmatimonadota bacterium]MDH5759513.1 hypothetical protein [Gemmatimonadota bacterium]
MGDVFYTARSTVRRVAGTHRTAVLEDGTTLQFGVHGPVKAHYGLEAEPDFPLPVDYIVASGCG